MIAFKNGGFLIESIDELINLPIWQTPPRALFGDFEATSRDSTKTSLNPWHSCWPIGFAVTVDDHPNAYFVPWAILDDTPTGYSEGAGGAGWNWLDWLFNSAEFWINHNVKYDAHVYLNATNGPDHWRTAKLPPQLRLVCTIALARLIDADRSYKGGYDLETLLKHWLNIDISSFGKALLPYTEAIDNKDYGRIPLDVLAEYACADVLENRKLYYFEIAHLQNTEAFIPCYSESGEIVGPCLIDTEIDLTRVLLDMERVGLALNPVDVMIADHYACHRMLNLEEVLTEKLGYAINPMSPVDRYDVICNRYGQPVRKWTNIDKNGNKTDKSNPSFDKETMLAYREALDTPDELKDIIKCIIAYTKESQARGLFYKPWQVLAVADKITNVHYLHGSYTQNVRSGRMACREPNEQQLNARAKELILPPPGYVLLSFDESQVEYRGVVHYIDDARTIQAYADDPDTDFHDWVALICGGIPRKPAKTNNFMMAFGGGKKKTIAKLARDFNELGWGLTKEQAAHKGEETFAIYHRNLPTLKKTSNHLANVARGCGYVRNIAGRRLHLPGPEHNKWVGIDGKLIDRCHIALNRIVQSSASDIAKEMAVRISRPGGVLEKYGAFLLALVHDEFLIAFPDAPDWYINQCANEIRKELEHTPFKLKVPLRCDCGMSRKNWADCGKAAYSDIATRLGGGRIPRDNFYLHAINYERAIKRAETLIFVT